MRVAASEGTSLPVGPDTRAALLAGRELRYGSV
jgi:hypothetical protein